MFHRMSQSAANKTLHCSLVCFSVAVHGLQLDSDILFRPNNYYLYDNSTLPLVNALGSSHTRKKDVKELNTEVRQKDLIVVQAQIRDKGSIFFLVIHGVWVLHAGFFDINIFIFLFCLIIHYSFTKVPYLLCTRTTSICLNLALHLMHSCSLSFCCVTFRRHDLHITCPQGR